MHLQTVYWALALWAVKAPSKSGWRVAFHDWDYHAVQYCDCFHNLSGCAAVTNSNAALQVSNYVPGRSWHEPSFKTSHFWAFHCRNQTELVWKSPARDFPYRSKRPTNHQLVSPHWPALIITMSEQKLKSDDDSSQALAMDVDTQSNGTTNSQNIAPAVGSSSADQSSEMEAVTDSQSSKPTRREIEMNKRQRSLAEFLSMMDNYTPAVSSLRLCCIATQCGVVNNLQFKIDTGRCNRLLLESNRFRLRRCSDVCI